MFTGCIFTYYYISKLKKKFLFRLVTVIIPVSSGLKKCFKKVLVINDKEFEFIAMF